jgi:GAF domain-containing protein
MARRSAAVSGAGKPRRSKVAKTAANKQRRKPASVAELRAQMTATSRVLELIAKSPSDLQLVFDAIVQTVVRLVGCETAFIQRCDGRHFWSVARCRREDGLVTVFDPRHAPIDPNANFPSRAIVGRTTLHLPDWSQIELPEFERRIQEQLGYQSAVYLPLLREEECIGVLGLAGSRPGMFGETEIALAESFRDQALIAIENTRLFDAVQTKTRDLEESLQQQTATSEVLQVISRSVFDLKTVLQTLLESAAGLCDASICILFQSQGDLLHVGASYGGTPEFVEYLTTHPHRFDRTTVAGRAAVERRTVHIPDIAADTEYGLPQSIKLGGWQSIIGVPLLRDGEVLGVLDLARPVAGPFTPQQIKLIETFADQAVIAIENARLFDEVQAKTHDLEVALQQQTATADVLKVISRSAFDLDTVLATLVESAARLCDAERGMIFLRQFDQFHMSANFGFSPEFAAFARAHPFSIDGGSTTARAAASGTAVQTIDILADETQGELARRYQQLGGHRTNLGVPLRREGQTIGVFTLTRQVVREFTTRQIELVSTFADQAVIAIENVRLFDEVQAKTRDLEVSLQQQTATADILRIISRSVAHAAPVFDTILEACERLFQPFDAAVYLVEGNRVRGVAHRGPGVGDWGADSMPLEGSSTGSAIALRRPVHFPDLADKAGLPENKRTSIREAGGMTVLYAPMISQESGVGSLVVTRRPKKPFTEAEIALIQIFADQAVIAIENVRLFDQVQARTRELSKSLDDLRTAQDRLVQTEKLASLGQLTAGIAHEIKNPLNFVNNFSALSAELIGELDETLAPAPLDQSMRDEVGELTGMLKSNLEKVVQHGKRADSIVKNMLLHSREGSGERRSQDLNALVSESLNLAYHGARAERPDFNITLEQDLDPDAGAVEVYPQDITRALLNLFSNGFYAAISRKKEADCATFEPVLSAATRNAGDTVEIRIRDNGTGILPEIREKIFNPFFTTKPTGEGTGLGLSMTHDIIVKQHGGRIDLTTEAGAFTEFTITLPRANR